MPCDTFVSEYAPSRTPRLEKGKEGFLLFLSFTPAPNEEANQVAAAAGSGKALFEVAGVGRRFTASGLSAKHELVVPVASVEEANSLLLALCFKKDDLYVP